MIYLQSNTERKIQKEKNEKNWIELFLDGNRIDKWDRVADSEVEIERVRQSEYKTIVDYLF